MKPNTAYEQEKVLRGAPGMLVLLINIVLILASIAGIISLSLPLLIAGIVYLCLPCWLLFAGLKVLRPGEALVLTLFGKYHGTLKKDGFFFVNPFCTAVNPVSESMAGTALREIGQALQQGGKKTTATGEVPIHGGKKISLKAMTLNNDRQKVNDQLGNPIEIGVMVIWQVVNTARAVFCVDNYIQYLSTQADSALRNIVRLYPYDATDDGESSLRGSSQEVAGRLQQELQEKVDIAGLEILEVRITHLAYAPEIAAAMLQRQQASAIIDARKMIVDGAVSMVEMALQRLSEHNVVELDEERRAAMVSNLLVVLCGNKDAQPVVNSGSLY